MAAALDEVASGRIPKDRLALKCLYDDMASWPYLQDTEPARPAAAPAAAAAAPGAAGEARDAYAALSQAGPDSIVKPYIMGKEARAGDKPQTLADLMPDWVGYGTLYGISLIPVMLAVGAVAVIFFSSLR
ncbi:hypothetical protein MNEG_16546 [Monoraphidium neglectum]|uniref:Uncharacterized protein n=1 Tax=Monoraphidium neglectum TaxID=145388 RepID=A0A0D2K5G5_9CHLO|nr:hypothetical protein MNEG_16546 [Monoraphidium neglectum]KIY91418.1 hypothetical protein MNEG_16546 [Monoraphidium neglectum]|eukprot:XP_013890438.1 hypothetical protein MNEG_16546 [Monoraphidium neglectum]